MQTEIIYAFLKKTSMFRSQSLALLINCIFLLFQINTEVSLLPSWGGGGSGVLPGKSKHLSEIWKLSNSYFPSIIWSIISHLSACRYILSCTHSCHHSSSHCLWAYSDSLRHNSHLGSLWEKTSIFFTLVFVFSL